PARADARMARGPAMDRARGSKRSRGVGSSQEGKPDVILLDLMMPEMDGFQVVAALQKEAGWRDIPVILITSLDLDAKGRERLNAGVQFVLVKERFRPADLVERIRRLVHRKPHASNEMEAASWLGSHTNAQGRSANSRHPRYRSLRARARRRARKGARGGVQRVRHQADRIRSVGCNAAARSRAPKVRRRRSGRARGVPGNACPS